MNAKIKNNKTLCTSNNNNNSWKAIFLYKLVYLTVMTSKNEKKKKINQTIYTYLYKYSCRA